MKTRESFQLGSGPLTPIPDFEPIKGTEKYVFKMTDGTGEMYAAKIFYEQPDDTYRDTIRERVKQEVRGKFSLQKTPLGIYLPDYRFSLSNENGDLIGIATKWEEGETLEKMKDRKPLSRAEFDRYLESVLATIDMGIMPFVDMLGANNIMFCPSRSPRIMLAEAALEEGAEMNQYLVEFGDVMDGVQRYINHV